MRAGGIENVKSVLGKTSIVIFISQSAGNTKITKILKTDPDKKGY